MQPTRLLDNIHPAAVSLTNMEDDKRKTMQAVKSDGDPYDLVVENPTMIMDLKRLHCELIHVVIPFIGNGRLNSLQDFLRKHEETPREKPHHSCVLLVRILVDTRDENETWREQISDDSVLQMGAGILHTMMAGGTHLLCFPNFRARLSMPFVPRF